MVPRTAGELLLKVRRRNYPICPLAHSPMIFRGFAKSCNLAMFARLTPRRASSPTEYGSGIRTDCSSKFVSVKRPLQTRSRFASMNRGASARKMHRTALRSRPSDRDPWGSYSEYSSDIDYIPVNHDWQAGDHSADDAFYVWGPVPPADFAFNYETAVT